MSGPALDPVQLAAAVEHHLGTSARIEGLRRLSGGASRETWSFDVLTSGGDRHALVLRRDPGAHAGTSPRSVEYALLEAARRGGVAVPAVRFLLEPGDELGSGFVMERIPGETIPRRILRDDVYADARAGMARQCGELAARIHAVDTATLPPLPAQAAASQVTQYRELIDGLGEPHPTFELGLRWLDERAPPPPERTTLVHGDFRNGNFVVGPDGIRAVLDWELAHLGDPAEDLGWLCVTSWRFGVHDRPVGGFGSVTDLLAGYRDAGGGAVDPDRVRYWEVLGTLKWGVICQLQASTHLSGVVRSVELAALGRRVAETEWDLLELIG
ncbi:MAG TPA: phosphotransferase family protein [Acidimicrobiia bacterium]